MENLLFSLNATLPIFLMMILGWLFRKLGLFNDNFVSVANRFVFQVALPVLLFRDLSGVNLSDVWDGRFVAFCFLVTLISILAAAALSLLVKDSSIRGEFTQASYRSSAAILGIAFMQNIYGTSGMAPLMIVATVPLYNAMAVVILTLSKPGSRHSGHFSKTLIFQTLRDIVTNPIILGILIGLLWSALKLPLPVILKKTVDSVAGLATPLGLMAMGAAFDPAKAISKIKPAAGAAFIKLIGLMAVFLPLAIILGFRQEKLVAILVMLGSATTVSSYIMARNMGHDGTLSASVVMLTTFLSAFTLTGWLWLVKSLGLI